MRVILSAAALFFVAKGQICPDTGCWLAVNETCTFQPASPTCDYEVNCAAENMTVTFIPSQVFPFAKNLSDIYGGESASGSPCIQKVDEDMSGNLSEPHIWSSDFDDCGIELEMIEDDFIFAATLKRLETGAKHTFSGVDVFIGAQETSTVAAVFECKYSAFAQIGSDGFIIDRPYGVLGSPDDTKSNDTEPEKPAEFSNGFGLKYYESAEYVNETAGDSEIGGMVYAAVHWGTKALSGKVEFFIDSCYVEDRNHRAEDGNAVALIDDSCYASAFGAQLNGNKTVEAMSKFQYSSFSYDISTSNSQTVRCEIQLCLILWDKETKTKTGLKCVADKFPAETADDCPQDPSKIGYQYTPTGL